jgi:hypothetical protein
MVRDIQRMEDASGTARHCCDLGEVLRSCHAGRVDVLCAAIDASAWGRFQPLGGQIELHSGRRPDDDDLVDLAVASALGRGTTVHALHRDDLPGDGLVAALLRY